LSAGFDGKAKKGLPEMLKTCQNCLFEGISEETGGVDIPLSGQ
jgi:hypothetical protein